MTSPPFGIDVRGSESWEPKEELNSDVQPWTVKPEAKKSPGEDVCVSTLKSRSRRDQTKVWRAVECGRWHIWATVNVPGTHRGQDAQKRPDIGPYYTC